MHSAARAFVRAFICSDVLRHKTRMTMKRSDGRSPSQLRSTKITTDFLLTAEGSALIEVAKGRQSGRTLEIQRLIGRSLRTVVDLDALGERSVIVDCDVLQADGGTRTASITGAWVALVIAINKLVKFGTLKRSPVRDIVT